MNFWDYFPRRLELLFEKIKKRMEEILDKEIDCEKLILFSDGLYCVKNGKKRRFMRISHLEKRIDEERKFRDLLFLYNGTYELVNRYRKLLETVNVEEYTLRRWLRKNINQNPYAERFISKLNEYFPKAKMGDVFKYKVENRKENVIRLWSGFAFINEKGELIALSYTHLGTANLKDLDKFEKSLNTYHSFLYFFVYKRQLKFLVNDFLENLASVSSSS